MKHASLVRLLRCGAAVAVLASTPLLADESAPPDVRKLFANSCSWCHGDFGMKEGKGGPKLAGTRMSEDQVKDRITNGKKGAMPGFKSTLKEDQIQALTEYVKGLPAN